MTRDRRIPVVTLALLAAWMLAPEGARAAPDGSGAAPAAHHGEGHHAHVLTGFGGATFLRPDTLAATVGVDYAYRINGWLGTGGFVEYAFGPVGELIAGPALFLFPVGGMFLELAPAIDVDREGHVGWLGRVAAGWEFGLTDHLLLGPYVATDWTSHHVALVGGLLAGYGF